MPEASVAVGWVLVIEVRRPSAKWHQLRIFSEICIAVCPAKDATPRSHQCLWYGVSLAALSYGSQRFLRGPYHAAGYTSQLPGLAKVMLVRVPFRGVGCASGASD